MHSLVMMESHLQSRNRRNRNHTTHSLRRKYIDVDVIVVMQLRRKLTQAISYYINQLILVTIHAWPNVCGTKEIIAPIRKRLQKRWVY